MKTKYWPCFGVNDTLIRLLQPAEAEAAKQQGQGAGPTRKPFAREIMDGAHPLQRPLSRTGAASITQLSNYALPFRLGVPQA
ncbi:MAG TPA: hypothetical protein VGB92_26790 [Longimicrobium sp.]|jgi:hypothetical protein